MATTSKVATAKTKAPGAKKVALTPLSRGVGRRKKAIARVYLYKGKGDIIVNGLKHSEYFDTDITRLDAAQPFVVIPNVSHYDVHANVGGGGLTAQAGAVKLSISRALVALDEALKVELRKHGLLTVDARQKERKKYGRKAARRSFQFVKR